MVVTIKELLSFQHESTSRIIINTAKYHVLYFLIIIFFFPAYKTYLPPGNWLKGFSLLLLTNEKRTKSISLHTLVQSDETILLRKFRNEYMFLITSFNLKTICAECSRIKGSFLVRTCLTVL